MNNKDEMTLLNTQEMNIDVVVTFPMQVQFTDGMFHSNHTALFLDNELDVGKRKKRYSMTLVRDFNRERDVLAKDFYQELQAEVKQQLDMIVSSSNLFKSDIEIPLDFVTVNIKGGRISYHSVIMEMNSLKHLKNTRSIKATPHQMSYIKHLEEREEEEQKTRDVAFYYLFEEHYDNLFFEEADHVIKAILYRLGELKEQEHEDDITGSVGGWGG